MPRLADNSTCTGCMSCYNVCRHNAISIGKDKDGFLIPQIDSSKCVDCKLCEMSCPVLNVVDTVCDDNPKAFALWSTLDRTISSSGGAFSAFSRDIISRGGVVFGAVFDKDFNLHHVEATTVDGLAPMRGSKYVQSNICNTFRKVKEYLRSDRYVLFCGTPCQVAGLRSFLKKDYEKLLLLDLACHGVPSNEVFKSYKRKLEKKLGKSGEDCNFVSCRFRRYDGWGKSLSVISDDKSIRYLYGVDALYMEAFNASALFRESCYSCKYASLPRIGDCSLADFWGIGRHGIPFKHDVMKGVSLVIVNTPKGQRFLDGLNDVFCEERTINEALIENHNLRESSVRHSKRDDIIRDFLNSEISLEIIDKRYHLVDHSFKATVKTFASKYGVFDVVKRVYNKYKTL